MEKIERWALQDSNTTCSVPLLDFLFAQTLQKILNRASSPPRPDIIGASVLARGLAVGAAGLEPATYPV